MRLNAPRAPFLFPALNPQLSQTPEFRSPEPAMLAPRPQPHRNHGFSLIELLTVMGIAAVLSTLAVSAFKGNTANHLSAGVQKTLAVFTQARSEAAVKRLPCRVAIATNWPGNETAEYRAASLWRINPDDRTKWVQVSNWEYLPDGVFFSPDEPSLPADQYDSKGLEYILGPSLANTFSQDSQNKTVGMRYIEFLPSGSVRTENTVGGTDFYVRVIEGARQGGKFVVRRVNGEDSTNYGDIVADGLVGRIKANRL